MGHFYIVVDQMRLDKMGLDEMAALYTTVFLGCTVEDGDSRYSHGCLTCIISYERTVLKMLDKRVDILEDFLSKLNPVLLHFNSEMLHRMLAPEKEKEKPHNIKGKCNSTSCFLNNS